MSVQLRLNFSIEFEPIADPPSRIDERFEAFHKANPHVYAELLRLARDAKRRGMQKLGMRALYEVLRWNEKHKLNDNYISRYARRLNFEPDLAGLFELRRGA